MEVGKFSCCALRKQLMACSFMEVAVVHTLLVAPKSLACLLMLIGTLLNDIDGLPNLVGKRFPMDMLHRLEKPGPQNSDAGDPEDNDEDDDDDDEDAGDEDFSGGEEGQDDDEEADLKDDPVANGNEGSDDEDDDDDDDDGEDGEDGEEDDDEEEEEEEDEDEEEEEDQPPAKKRK